MMFKVLFGALATSLVAPAVLAQTPAMGGPMKHVGVEMMGSELHTMVDPGVPTPELKNYGLTYSANAGVLTGLRFNAQYGWMVEGFWSVPQGSSIWIEQTGATRGLRVFRGGMGGNSTFAPIFGTDGSSPRILWNGTMLHNWYAAGSPGTYEATYSVYLGDAAGNPTPGYTPATVTLTWIAQPPACPADANGDGVRSPTDLFAFLTSYFAGEPGADFNANGTAAPEDIFAFLTAYFAGC